MPKITVTRATLKNHFQYGKWVYLAIAVGGIALGMLLFDMTEHRARPEHRVDIELVQGGFADAEALHDVAAQVLAVGQQKEPLLEEVNFYSVSYTGDPSDVYGVQKFATMVYAGEGHIWIVPDILFETLIEQGAPMPLDDLITQNILRPGDADLSAFTRSTPEDPTERVYALPATLIPSLTLADYHLQDRCAVILQSCPTPELTAVVLQALMEA